MDGLNSNGRDEADGEGAESIIESGLETGTEAGTTVAM